MAAMENPYDTAARQEAAPDALWDVAYYGGRYYVYFGLVPCLLFQLPFEALTGVRDLPPSLPMILLAWLMIWASFGCVKQALRRWFPRASAAAYLLATTGMAAGSQIWYLLLRPLVYEYAILSGAAFVLLGLWQWLLAANTPTEKTRPTGLPSGAGQSLHCPGGRVPPPDGSLRRAGAAHLLEALCHRQAAGQPCRGGGGRSLPAAGDSRGGGGFCGTMPPGSVHPLTLAPPTT